MSSSFLQQLGITVPLLQAPMAGATTPALAAAVSNAGALGGHGCAALSVEAVANHIQEIRRHTSGPFNLNFFCHDPTPLDNQQAQQWIEHFRPLFTALNAPTPNTLTAGYTSLNHNPAMVDLLLKKKPAVLSFHFGVPTPEMVRAFKAQGIILLGCATRLSEAEAIAHAGLDGIIVQGKEAGGHQGVFDRSATVFEPLLELLPRIQQQVSLPLIAAGGIMTGEHIARVMQAGACAAQLGTAFLLCPETQVSPSHRQALQQKTGEETALMSEISGRPARGFIHPLHQKLSPHKAQLPAYPYPYSITKALIQAARAQQNNHYDVHWAGTGVGKIREMKAQALVATLEAERQAALR